LFQGQLSTRHDRRSVGAQRPAFGDSGAPIRSDVSEREG
jgi:hypothetical protein